MRRSWPPARRRDEGSWTAVASAVIALAGFLAAGSGALADLKLPPRPRGDPPMRIVRVMSSDPACEPNCPEWISAEGMILPGTAAAFRKAIFDLDGRRLPVLISSHGGSLGAALQMGELIRERRLAVAVARTLIANCPERTPVCPGARGQAITGGAVCASACPLILAGGVERLVGPVPMVGVHQITEVLKEKEGLAHLTTIKKIYEPGFADITVQAYLSAMGVGDPVMTLLRKTPAGSIRWLSLPEMIESHLATQALDAAAPVMTSGANGLNGHAFDGATARADLFVAHAAVPLAGSADSARPTLEATFAYRRGGGGVEAQLREREAATRPAGEAPGWTLTNGGGEPLVLKATAGEAAGATIPRERFCGLFRNGKVIAAPMGGPPPKEPIAFDLTAMGGAKALLEEACP
ncbi:MAG: hypothetical protein JO223_13880 [Hyphomicrobiales bacterium]|nr:hypothetical protein [Hyphomicrobiales bacterium]